MVRLNMILEFQSEKRTIYVAILYKDGKIVKIGRDRKPRRAPDVYVKGATFIHNNVCGDQLDN
jgi:dihydroorotase-like cyclic amidohydrolase